MSERTEIGSEMYVLFDDEIARMKLEFWRGRVFVHYAAKGTALRVALRAARIWPRVRAICAALGYARIEALFPSSAPLERLCALVGFTDARHANGVTHMECQNA